MAILSFGEHLPPVYLERFNPPENQVTRISILAQQVVGIESHWVDLPILGIKGMYRCTGGICCSSGAFGRRSQYYHLPIYVYTNPQVSAEGQIMDWSLTKTVYDSIVTLAQRYDLTKWDLDVVKTVQGQGTRTNFTIVPDVQMRIYWTPEQTQKINESVQMFYSIAESTLVQEANDQTYQEMLMQAGFNFETKQFPQLPQSNYKGANVAIGSAVMPPMGASAPRTSLPGMVAPAMPTPPQIGTPASPVSTGSSAPLSTGTMPQIQSASPVSPTIGSPVTLSTGTQIPQTPSASPVPSTIGTPAQPAMSTGTPPGAPVPPIGQPVVQNIFQQMAPLGQSTPSSVVASPAQPNTVPGAKATELSDADIDALLGKV